METQTDTHTHTHIHKISFKLFLKCPTEQVFPSDTKQSLGQLIYIRYLSLFYWRQYVILLSYYEVVARLGKDAYR